MIIGFFAFSVLRAALINNRDAAVRTALDSSHFEAPPGRLSEPETAPEPIGAAPVAAAQTPAPSRRASSAEELHNIDTQISNIETQLQNGDHSGTFAAAADLKE